MRRFRFLCALVSIAATSLVAGCMFDVGGDDRLSFTDGTRSSGDGDRADNGGYRPIREGTNGRISGELGPLTGLDNAATGMSIYDDGYYLSVETVVELEDRAAMTLLSASQASSFLVPGLRATFTAESMADEGVGVTLLGCVGEQVDVYSLYDSPADEVDVTIDEAATTDEADEALDVAVTARWYDRDAAGERLDSFRTADTRFTLLR